MSYTDQFPMATFVGDFPHWADEDDDSFVGQSKKLIVRPTHWTDRWLLVPATMRVDGTFLVIPRAYNLWARHNRANGSRFPSCWQDCRYEAEEYIPYIACGKPYFYGENHGGKPAGQQIPLPHGWYYERGFDEFGLLCEDLGFVGVINAIRDGRILKPQV
jgi:hypothetical protein